ncbi:nicotinate-nucleotide--dimethylbenzimidazole phosphoribosyltransferase [Paenibacillus sp. GCM10027626]|uniref:nicotinate-nucleotide--dimethylbenzimidazole phosphoribosyltransferase n=1 Tax=Paenibacillus sp. GCM10027626 TaxID=3273411 RepID=UPI00363200CD
MKEQQLYEIIARIAPMNVMAMEASEQYSNTLTKPPGSLGKLEAIARQAAGITGELAPDWSRRAVIVMAGDHGVCEEGVSAFPAEVTPQMVANFLAGGAAVNVLARQAGADVYCVDVGVNAELADHPSLRRCKVRPGTANMARGAAMERTEALQAIAAGIAIVDELADKGYRLFATGEMGIGNTTASAALCTVLANITAEDAVGLGTGISEAARKHKIEVVQRAIAVNEPDVADVLGTLAKLGGLEIAGLAGVIIGAASRGCPVVIDGFIASAAALVAGKLAPAAIPYMLASHLSHEQGHRKLLAAIGLSPMIHLDMRLGEGTGAVLCFHFIDAALLIMREMATFESAGVSNQ